MASGSMHVLQVNGILLMLNFEPRSWPVSSSSVLLELDEKSFSSSIPTLSFCIYLRVLATFGLSHLSRLLDYDPSYIYHVILFLYHASFSPFVSISFVHGGIRLSFLLMQLLLLSWSSFPWTPAGRMVWRYVASHEDGENHHLLAMFGLSRKGQHRSVLIDYHSFLSIYR